MVLKCLPGLTHNVHIRTNKEELIGDEKVEGNLDCSDHESQELSILR